MAMEGFDFKSIGRVEEIGTAVPGNGEAGE
jgi:hypothetical protein